MLPYRHLRSTQTDRLYSCAHFLNLKAQVHAAISVEGKAACCHTSTRHSCMLLCRYMHGTKADKLYDSTRLLDVKAQLDVGECGMQEVSFYHQHKNNVDFVFVDHPVYHRPGELVIISCINYLLYS